MNYHFAYIFFLLFFFSCSNEKRDKDFEFNMAGNDIHISLQQLSDTLYNIRLKKNGNEFTSSWKLNYPVYRFDMGDVDGDDIPEIAVGVIKTTRYDSTPGKRLFIFRITDDGYIRPLWLGSRVAQPLEDFILMSKQHPALIRTIEKERDGKFLVATYQWQGFGLKFNNYIRREISKQDAQKLLHDN